MNSLTNLTRFIHPSRPARRWFIGLKVAAVVALGAVTAVTTQAQTSLADQPVFGTPSVPGNLVLALSVEFPTAVTAADRSGTYSNIKKYLGYFDPNKCYTYTITDVTNGSYFYPVDATDASYNCSGGNRWSGNFMNWATMQAVDPFRWALTGGYRAVDTPTLTILEKAVAPPGQGSTSNNFPNKTFSGSISAVTPFGGSNFYMHVARCGNKMVFTQNSAASVSGDNCPSGVTPWDGAANVNTTVYSVDVRVKVCASSTLAEANCKQYGSNYKPEGLIQKYAAKIRYSAFGYLTDPPDGGSKDRDGGVLRARMKFVGPTQPVPGSTPISNVVGATTGQVTSAEWSSTDGTFYSNPDTQDATNSSETLATISKSGVINYLNQFGLTAQAYKYYDPVSELYYAATRYLRGVGDVARYSDLSYYNGIANASALADRIRMRDGFPVIRNWVDPILYSCQKNFVLGIGDTNSNQDKDLPGNTAYRTAEPSMPTEVSTDFSTNGIDVIAATNKVGVMEGDMGATIGATDSYNTSNNSAYMAGLAYQFNTTDIRADLPGTQSISTFWLDVLEGDGYKPGPTGRNQFYLATKYGGFTVPAGFSYATNTAMPLQALWSTNGDTIPVPSANSPRPDNYFVANQADKMVAGLESAFLKISNAVAAFTTSFSTSLPQVAALGNSSFSSQYDPAGWTGEVTASNLSFDATTGAPVLVQAWKFTDIAAVQFAGTGWTTRKILTWDGTTGVPFEATGTNKVSTADLALLDTSYVTGNDSTNYLNYLRGERANEASNSGGVYRTRTKLLGDVVGSKARPIGPPSFPFSDAFNPGYSAFKSAKATRRTTVYVGSNDGMMHAINGALSTVTTTPPVETDANAGKEMFAYVPRALYAGPNNTPNVNGLASLGNPSFVHHNLVNATPNVYDVDFGRTPNASGVAQTGTADWRSILIGGLGKGGKSYYALDVTDPTTVTEANASTKVLWEFSNNALGFTFGDPVVAKTRKYGWVVILPSGYNNADGKGYFLIINPRTGVLLEPPISTGAGATNNDAGLANANAFVVDATDGTADAVYAGDLLGNLWRLDLTAASGNYPAPVKIAQFTDASTTPLPQPVTSRPSIEVHPATKQRFVMVGTGRLLDTSDIASTQGQTFYAIIDGNNSAFNATGAPVNFPYTRAKLANNLDPVNTPVSINSATQGGWYEELGTDTTTTSPVHTGTGIAWRVTTDSTTLSGSVAFAATLPNGSVCSPSGNSRIYGRDYASARSTIGILNADGSLTNTVFVPQTGNVTDLRYLSVGGRATLISGTDVGSVSKVEINPLGNLLLRRLNWRELQSVD